MWGAQIWMWGSVASSPLKPKNGLNGPPAIVLSGFATPIANMPRIVQYITLLDPLRYFLIVLRGSFLEGAGASLFWPQYWPLAVIGIVSMIVAGRLFRRRLF